MKNQTRVNQRSEEELGTSTPLLQQGGLAFETPDDALRADRSTIQVPTEVTTRIQTSFAAESPAPEAPWWKRFFRR